ncbi:MAG: hypothetical protein ABIR65_01200 [Pseudolysinimonas sp.]
MTNWMICDGHGNKLTDGYQAYEHEIERVTQCRADELGVSLWYGPSNRDGDEDAFTEVAPS